MNEFRSWLKDFYISTIAIVEGFDQFVSWINMKFGGDPFSNCWENQDLVLLPMYF